MSELEEESKRKKNGYKTIILVFLIVAMVYAIPVSFNSISTAIGTQYNPTHPNIYQEDNVLKYKYQDELDKTLDLELEVEVDDDGEYADVTVELDGDEKGTFICETETGYLKGTKKYVLFWIFTTNNVLDPLSPLMEEEELEVVDPVGILGKPDKEFTFVFEERNVYWNVPPALMGAQYSFKVDVFNQNETKVTTATLDSTSGILEIMEGKVDLTLEDPGNFPMSRHRITILWGVIVCAIAIPVLGYLYMRWKQRQQQEKEDFTLLLSMGAAAVLLDFILDVWFYSFVGVLLMFILHIIVAVIFSLVLAFKFKINPLWMTPMYIEIAFAIGLNLHTGVSYFPSLTVGLGLFLSFLIILYRISQIRPIF